MIDKELSEFLCKETAFEDIGSERLLHDYPPFQKTVGQAINSGNLLNVSIELSSLLKDMDLYKACLISNFIGFACEKEENAAAGREIIGLFVTACNNVYEMLKNNEAEGGDEIPSDLSNLYMQNRDWIKAYCGFDILCITAMAFLTRDAGLRILLRDPALGDKISYLAEEAPESPYLRSIYYVNRMQKTCSGLRLLVLQPERQQGFWAAADDIDNCFHLIFLLEEQIAEQLSDSYGMPGFAADEALIRLAHGEYPDDCQNNSYHTFFTEYNYGAVLKSSDIGCLIWGEMPPECIPAIDGCAVIILEEKGINRSFDTAFLASFHTALTPSVKIERVLTGDEYKMWINKIKGIGPK